MEIVVHEDNTGCAPADCRFAAVDVDTYDGDRTSWHRCSTVGYGSTPTAAILDWIEITYDDGEITEDEAHELMRIYGVRRDMWHWANRA